MVKPQSLFLRPVSWAIMLLAQGCYSGLCVWIPSVSGSSLKKSFFISSDLPSFFVFIFCAKKYVFSTFSQDTEETRFKNMITQHCFSSWFSCWCLCVSSTRLYATSSYSHCLLSVRNFSDLVIKYIIKEISYKKIAIFTHMLFGIVNGDSVSDYTNIIHVTLNKTSNCCNYFLFIPLLRLGFPP